MNQEMPEKIVGVRFSTIGKNYYFNANHIDDIVNGDFVVVETSRGWQMGEVTEILKESDSPTKPGIKKIDRKATHEDLIKKQELNTKEEIALSNCTQIAHQLKMRGIKIISTEIGFDEKTISILYSYPDEEEIKGFSFLQKRLKEEYANMKMELHKIGPRDAAKYFGGMGACGMESRCCTQFLVDFQSISIKMAKIQQISLSPSDITGMCDRLRCCLNYEYHLYEEILHNLPKKNQMVHTPIGEGKVVDIIPMQNKVVVELTEAGEKIFDIDEISSSVKIGSQSSEKPQPYKKNQTPHFRRRR